MISEDEQKRFINTVKKACDFFRNVRVWPLETNLDYEGWISNFIGTQDQYLASLILCNFIYYPQAMIRKLLYDAVGNACGYFKKSDFCWQHDHHKRKVLYSFIPGETPNPTDSGFTYLKIARDYLHIPSEQIIHFSDIENKLECDYTKYKIVFLDDFIGSGLQCCKALNGYGRRSCIKLIDLAKAKKHQLVYAPIIANTTGLERIKEFCPYLIVSPGQILGKEYNIFEEESLCWGNDKELWLAGTEMILRYSKQLGIPDDAEEENSARGYQNQGLTIAFEYGIPDAVPALFYFNECNWKPLMHREYERIANNE